MQKEIVYLLVVNLLLLFLIKCQEKRTLDDFPKFFAYAKEYKKLYSSDEYSSR